MQTAFIGKKFINYFNECYNKQYTPKEFFIQEMFPLFFDDEHHLMHVGNSPFFHKANKEETEKFGNKSKAQLNKLIDKINNRQIGGSIYVGYGAEDINSTTTGQITSINVDIDENEIFASWIGQALFIGVGSNFSISLDNKDILLKIHQGWTYYKKFVKETEGVKDKQIETWNGVWVSEMLNNETMFDFSKIKVKKTGEKLAIVSQEWTRILFAISKKIKNETITLYAHLLSQTNQTLGFVNFISYEIKRFFEFRDSVFIDGNSILSDREIALLESIYSFEDAFKMGVIGLSSFEPKNLKLNEETKYLYEIWIKAMINDKKMIETTEKFVNTLLDFESQAIRAKKENTNLVSEILSSNNLKKLIDAITKILNEENKEVCNEFIHFAYTKQNELGLLISFLNFKYNYLKK